MLRNKKIKLNILNYKNKITNFCTRIFAMLKNKRKIYNFSTLDI